MKIDLHTHSSRSDGTDTPAQLVENAAAAGLNVVALTDHDTTAGWGEAEVAAQRHGIVLVKGIELSTRNEGRGQHLLGYGFDPGHPAIVDMLAKAATSRQGRIDALLDRLEQLGLPVDREAVWRDVQPGGVPGRAHVATAMVEAGHVPDRAAAFAAYLNEGGPAYVQRFAPTIEESIGALRAAGGVAVIAHPRGRRGHVTDERLAELAEAGLSGVEVDHQEHTTEVREALRAIADRLGLVATGSSDYHGTRKTDHDLGCNLTTPEAAEALLPGISGLHH